MDINFWFYVFAISFAFFLIKTIASFCFGDIDVDFDADGDTDFDISSMLSFKGVLHFFLGLSTYLSLVAKLDSNYTGWGSYDYTWYHYVIGLGVGLIFMFILYKLYQLMMKLNHTNTSNPDYNNCDCSILINNGKGYYTVLVRTPLGTYKTNARALGEVDNLEIGSEHKIIYDEETKQYILNNTYYTS